MSFTKTGKGRCWSEGQEEGGCLEVLQATMLIILLTEQSFSSGVITLSQMKKKVPGDGQPGTAGGKGQAPPAPAPALPWPGQIIRTSSHRPGHLAPDTSTRERAAQLSCSQQALRIWASTVSVKRTQLQKVEENTH